ncbi:MAG: hypothetical protein F4Z48_07595, partial [Dehalococcoidia bacterium]|nr:hypothetical protein [Dehalococcoidia bacterium]
MFSPKVLVAVVAAVITAVVVLGWGGSVRGQEREECGRVSGLVTGATYRASVTVRPGEGAETARLTLEILDDYARPVAREVEPANLYGTPVTLTASVVAPEGAAL